MNFIITLITEIHLNLQVKQDTNKLCYHFHKTIIFITKHENADNNLIIGENFKVLYHSNDGKLNIYLIYLQSLFIRFIFMFT